MKIAIFSDNFYPELSGIADSVRLLSIELAKLGHEIKFFVPKYSDQNYRAINLPVGELELGDKIGIHRMFSLPAGFAGLQARLVLPMLSGDLFKKFKPDIIHSQLFFGVGLEAMLRAWRHKLPLIGTNHTAITEFVRSTNFNSVLKRTVLNYCVWYYNHCNFVTAPSQSVFGEMEHYGFRQPHQVISNPIDVSIFSRASVKMEFKKEFNLSANTVIYAGRLSAEKNIEVVVRAVALAKQKIKNINLAIVGSGKIEPELKQLVVDLNLVNEVKFFGTLQQKQLARIYQASDIFALASTSETQSLTLMQAMAAGLPAIVVNARALPEYVNDQNGFVVKAGDHEAMAEKIMLVLENPELLNKLSQGAYNFVQQFSAANIAKSWEGLYGQVIEKYNK